MWRSARVSPLEAGTLGASSNEGCFLSAQLASCLSFLGKNELSVPVILATGRLDLVFQ